MPSKKRPPWFGPDDTAGCVVLGRELEAQDASGDETHPLFHEYVAREHLDGGMPVIELHRNHGIPLSAVKRWIATYRDEGREGLEREARERNAKAKKREDALFAKVPKPEEVAALRAKIESRDLAQWREAYATIEKRRLKALVPVIVEAVKWKNDDRRRDWSIQEELELLALLRAKEELHALIVAKLPIMRSYASWISGLMKQAGCAIRTVERPWSQSYELGGEWYRVPKE